MDSFDDRDSDPDYEPMDVSSDESVLSVQSSPSCNSEVSATSDEESVKSTGSYHGNSYTTGSEAVLKGSEDIKDIPSASSKCLSSVVVLTTNNSTNKRKWDKHQYCIYCMKPLSKLPRHLESKHATETDVSYAFSFPKRSRRRKILLQELCNKGNHAHNCEVLKAGKGYLIPYKRPTYPIPAAEYKPCPACLGYFVRRELTKHYKTCRVRIFKKQLPDQGCGRQIQVMATMMLPFHGKTNKQMRDAVLSKMITDEIGMAARNDPLIVEYGSKLFMKTRATPTCSRYVTQKMRQLSRLLLELRKGKKEYSLKDYIQPRNFDHIVKCVRTLAGYNSDSNIIKNPHLALHLGHALKSCALICKTAAIKAENAYEEKSADNFLQLCTVEWCYKISSLARSSAQEKKRNKPKYLPLVEDVVKLNQYLKTAAISTYADLKERPSQEAWQKLRDITLTQLILFNRKRSGEAERMTVKDFRNVRASEGIDTSLLSEWEKSLCKKIERVEIKGKRSSNVPVLLKSGIKQQIQLLIHTRITAGVMKKNPYIFACLQGSEMPIRASQCINKFARCCQLSHPERFTSTNLRKQIATMSQVFNLKENELDILAGFLGHDIRIHREYYRLPQSTLQVAKVTRLLMAFENGNIERYKNKNLDDIEINMHDVCDDEDNEPVAKPSKEKGQRCGVLLEDQNDVVTLEDKRMLTETQKSDTIGSSSTCRCSSRKRLSSSEASPGSQSKRVKQMSAGTSSTAIESLPD
ncbi:uncharacterized protein [Ptychodera flava]|uniref:uncharacterized protein n=1 Tax=Ptychodera flava TaxID=63121 RepID=UPI003969E284